jgi:hypothetical protein
VTLRLVRQSAAAVSFEQAFTASSDNWHSLGRPITLSRMPSDASQASSAVRSISARLSRVTTGVRALSRAVNTALMFLMNPPAMFVKSYAGAPEISPSKSCGSRCASISAWRPPFEQPQKVRVLRIAAVIGADDRLGRLGCAMDGDMSVAIRLRSPDSAAPRSVKAEIEPKAGENLRVVRGRPTDAELHGAIAGPSFSLGNAGVADARAEARAYDCRAL